MSLQNKGQATKSQSSWNSTKYLNGFCYVPKHIALWTSIDQMEYSMEFKLIEVKLPVVVVLLVLGTAAQVQQQGSRDENQTFLVFVLETKPCFCEKYSTIPSSLLIKKINSGSPI